MIKIICDGEGCGREILQSEIMFTVNVNNTIKNYCNECCKDTTIDEIFTGKKIKQDKTVKRFKAKLQGIDRNFIFLKNEEIEKERRN